MIRASDVFKTAAIALALCASTAAQAQSLPIAKSDNDFSACMSMPALKAAMAKENQSVVMKGENIRLPMNVTSNPDGKGYILSFHGPDGREACPVARIQITRAFDPATQTNGLPPTGALLGTNRAASLAWCEKNKKPLCGDHDAMITAGARKGLKLLFMGYILDEKDQRRGYVLFSGDRGGDGEIFVTSPSGASQLEKTLANVNYSDQWIRYFEKPVQVAANATSPSTSMR